MNTGPLKIVPDAKRTEDGLRFLNVFVVFTQTQAHP
jgi:hypothetical protein